MFVGWNTNHTGFKMGLQPAGPDALVLTYVFLKDGEAACCATGQEPITYRWDGTHLAPDRQPPPTLLSGPTIELTD